MDYGQIIHRSFDDSYVITKNSMSYHVPNEGEFAEEWAEVRAYAEAHPECVVVEQPYVPPVPTLEELKAAKKARIDAETSAAILAGFDYAVDGVNYANSSNYANSAGSAPANGGTAGAVSGVVVLSLNRDHACVLPSGGTWVYFYFASYQTDRDGYSSSNHSCGTAAGGSTIASGTGYYSYSLKGIAIRIS